MVTLYITDLDGTLLNNSANVSAESARIISHLTRQGALISVATARTPATVEPILADTLTAPELVVMTGAAVWNRPHCRFADIDLLPEADVELMLGIFRRFGIQPFCYVLNADGRFLDVYHPSPVLSPSEEVFVRERAQLTLKGFHLGQECPAADRDRVALFFGMGVHDAIVEVSDALKASTDCYISYYKDTYTPDQWLLEIFAPGVSKAGRVNRLRQRMGADRLVAFGDNLNDIPMLEIADLSVAVENALPEVKAVADIVIGPNTSDSVARFIQQDFATQV